MRDQPKAQEEWLSESPNGTVITEPGGRPIIDAFNNVWNLTSDRRVVVDGFLDPFSRGAIKLAYVDKLIWRQTEDTLWAAKAHPIGPWLPNGGTTESPVDSTISLSIVQVLGAIKALQLDFDTSMTRAGGPIAAIRSMVAELEETVGANQVAVMEQFAWIAAALKRITPRDHITLDTDHPADAHQPIPSGDGP